MSKNPTIIKKYPNRRLYNTSNSSYITMDELAQMIRKGEDVIVQDSKSNEDITRSVLTQIILDAESKEGGNLLPLDFLKQLIAFYGNQASQIMFPNFIAAAMENYTQQQRTIEDQFKNAFAQIMTNGNPFGQLGAGGLNNFMTQQQQLMQQSMQMFNPFLAQMMHQPADKDAIINQLQQQIKDLQNKINAL